MAIEAEVTRDGTAAPRPEMVGSVRIGSSCWLVILEIRVSQSSRNTPPSRTNKEECLSAGGIEQMEQSHNKKEKSANCDRDKESEGKRSRRHANQYYERKERGRNDLYEK